VSAVDGVFLAEINPQLALSVDISHEIVLYQLRNRGAISFAKVLALTSVSASVASAMFFIQRLIVRITHR
jgi:hypothetical protein